ncbi:MAG TPA: glycosyltransferase 87 family protein [Trebonia sp.]
MVAPAPPLRPVAPAGAGGGVRLRSRAASPRARALLVAVNLAAVTFFLSCTRHGVGFAPYRIDLDVYRIGGRVWLARGDLYGVLPATSSGARLPFSYPPIAAVLLSPLSLLPMVVAGTVVTLASVALTALVLRLFLRSAAGRRSGSWWVVGWLLPVVLFLEPVRNTLNFGQINIALMALVAADCLPESVRWPRGALVGLAAAVKLTPAAFVLFFLCRGDRRAAATAGVSFAGWSAVGFLLAPHDSVRYWTSVVFQTGRPGSLLYAANQSIMGVLARAGLDPRTPAVTGAWLALSAVVLALAWRGMRRALVASADARALSLCAFAALLISPVSWSHHWVWAAPALLVLAVGGLRTRRPFTLAAVAAGLAVFAAAPQWWFPSGGNRELHWAAWQQVAGSSYVILAVVVLCAGAFFDPGRQQVHDLGDTHRAQLRPPFRRIDPPQVGLAVELREGIPERRGGRIGLKRGRDVRGEIAALRAFRG